MCDEPTGALDSKTGIRVLEAVVVVSEDLKTTTALITHNVAIRDIAHRVVYFADGRIARVQENERCLVSAEISW